MVTLHWGQTRAGGRFWIPGILNATEFLLRRRSRIKNPYAAMHRLA